MAREYYGCPCCSGTFGGMFAVNHSVRALKKEAEQEGGWTCNWGIDFLSMGRRDFMKTGAATASLAAMANAPQQAGAQAQSTTIFSELPKATGISSEIRRM